MNWSSINTALLLGRARISANEIFDALYIYVGKIHHRALCLDQCLRRLQSPAERAQQRQRHHWRAVHTGSAMDEYLVFLVSIERFRPKIHAALEDLWRLRQEVIIDRVPQDLNAVRTSRSEERRVGKESR